MYVSSNMENESNTSNSARFYEQCSDILELTHTHIEPVPRRNRWNNRTPGNGRYQGYGVIRYYNERNIHIQFGSKGCGIFKNENDALIFLKNLKNNIDNASSTV